MMQTRAPSVPDCRLSGYMSPLTSNFPATLGPGLITTAGISAKAATSALAHRSARSGFGMVPRHTSLLTGTTGASGLTGTTGAPGLTGTTGAPGLTGTPGAPGLTESPRQMVPRLLGAPSLMTTVSDESARKSQRISEVGKTNEALERMATMHDVIGDVQTALVRMQEENAALKSRLLKSLQNSLRKFFMVSNQCLLTSCFAEWRDQSRTEKIGRELRAMEHRRSQDAKMFDAQLVDVKQQHLEEQAHFVRKQDRMKESFDQILYDERQKAAHQLLTQTSLTKDKQRQLDEANSKLSVLQEKFETAERIIAAVREGVKEHHLETIETPELVTHQGEVNDYIRERLHDILRATDPRYLGRSAHPTVAEISLNERVAYAESSACARSGTCLHHSQQALPSTQPQNPWGTRSGTSLRHGSHSTPVNPFGAALYALPSSAPKVQPALWKPT